MIGKFLRRFSCVLALSAPIAVPATAQTLAESAEPFEISYAEVDKVPESYRRQEVSYLTDHAPGTVVVDTSQRFLYLVLGQGRALRYGIGVGREGFQWGGRAEIGRKAPWPRWTPPKAMVARDAFAAKWAKGMPGGPRNPLGARALYLFANGVDTLFRIHGTNQPDSIGRAVSSGCVRMLNADIIDLYERVGTGTKVVVLRPPRPTMTAEVRKAKPRKIAEAPSPRRTNHFATRRAALKTWIVRKQNFNLRKTRLASQ
jgi:lipoprotein-anchoring transpeptidase ErfK/SrfK